MNICLVSQEYPPETARGGIGTQTWNKARTLAAMGHTIHVVSSTPSSDEVTRVDAREGVTVHRIQPPDHRQPVYGQACYWVGYSWSVFQYLRHLTSTTRFDVIDFAEYGAEGYVYQLDRSIYDWTPVVVQLHGPLAMFAERIGWPEKESALFQTGTFMEDYCIRQADALMACSANIACFTADYHKVPLRSIHVVHCGVDNKTFRPPEDAARAGAAPKVLFAGNIALNKGIGVVFEAVLRLRHKFPNIQLRVLGKGDDDLVNEFQDRAAAEGAAGNVEFLGFAGRDQIPRLYQDSAVFCSPATHEVGVANVYIEAMASGCPVVACNTGGAPEAVEDGRHGFLVPPNNVEATASALDRILSEPALRIQMANACRKRVEEYFAMDQYIQRVLSTYEEAIAKSAEKLERLRESSAG